jgi:hypothetical protein
MKRREMLEDDAGCRGDRSDARDWNRNVEYEQHERSGSESLL